MGARPVRACPCYGARRARSGLSREPRQQGEPAAGPLGPIARSRRRRPWWQPLPEMCGARTPPATSCWRLAADQVDQPVTGAVGPRHDGVERPGSHGARQCAMDLVGDLVALRGDGRPEEGPHPLGTGTAAPAWRPAPVPTAPAAVPRQPAWTAASTDVGRSTRASGTQSATRMASVTPGDDGHEDVGVGDGVVLRGGAAARGPPGRRAPPRRRGPGARRPSCRGRRRTPPPPGPG